MAATYIGSKSFRLAQIGPDEDLKMPILAALIIPAFAYVPAAPAA
jgi:hypothetical protein